VVENNVDQIPFYLSVPKSDLKIFHQYIDLKAIKGSYDGTIEMLSDEEIALAIDPNCLDNYYATKGYISQQVIKAQVWKLIPCDAYLSLDSDSFFTKPFQRNNFFHKSGIPFSIMHDGRALLEISDKLGHPKVREFFIKDSELLKKEFDRRGKDYDFGPAPLIWSTKIWQSLEIHLKARKETIWQAFSRVPSEIRWYGESLLKYQAIVIYPILPIFRCYHYDWQVKYYKKYPSQINDSPHIIGEVRQSNWDESLRPTFAKKNWTSTWWKKVKSIFKKR
jgi:hypothetical protein